MAALAHTCSSTPCRLSSAVAALWLCAGVAVTTAAPVHATAQGEMEDGSETTSADGWGDEGGGNDGGGETWGDGDGGDGGDTWGDSDGGDAWSGDPWAEEQEGGLPFNFSGFVELLGGHHTRDNELLDKDYNVAELRLGLGAQGTWRRFDYQFQADAVGDQVTEELRGELRKARLDFSLGNSLDMRVGRQVLTWGTGDLLFINDLFPKDFKSFLTGRDEDYLKGPSDAIRGTWYTGGVTIDLVWTPLFEPDDYPEGERLTYFMPRQGQTSSDFSATTPNSFPEDGELAAQIRTRVGSADLAGYLYRGFFPSPRKPTDDGGMTHGRLDAYGASIRDQFGPGIANAEVGYYNSVDYDSDSPSQAPNSQTRLLFGYNWEAVTNLNVGLQYYIEWLQDFNELEKSWKRDKSRLPEEYRNVLTTRLTYSIWRDNLTGSLFTFYSPADEDYYLRPSLSYRASDYLTYTAGANLFGGEATHTFYGQFEKDSNVYLRVRYRF